MSRRACVPLSAGNPALPPGLEGSVCWVLGAPSLNLSTMLAIQRVQLIKTHLQCEMYKDMCATVGFPDSSVGKESAYNAGDPGSISRSERYSGEGVGMYQCPGGAVTQTGDLDSRNCLGSRDQKSKIKVLAGLVPPEASLQAPDGCQHLPRSLACGSITDSWLLPHAASSLGVSASKCPLLTETQVRPGKSPD